MKRIGKRNTLRILGALIILGTAFIVYRAVTAPVEFERGGERVSSIVMGTPIDPATIGSVVADKESGREYISNEVIVEFQPDVSEADALEIIAGVGGTMLARFTQAPLFRIQVKDSMDGAGAQKAIAELSKNPKVKGVTLNYLTTATEKLSQ